MIGRNVEGLEVEIIGFRLRTFFYGKTETFENFYYLVLHQLNGMHSTDSLFVFTDSNINRLFGKFVGN